MIDKFKELLLRVWEFLKKIFVKVVSFIDNIVNFFKSKFNSIKKKHPNADAISLKIEANIKSGEYNSVKLSDYQIINTFYDKDTGKILADETEVISYESLDEQTKAQFSNKDMLVIEN